MKEKIKDLLAGVNINTLILAVAILLAAAIYCLFTWNHGRYQIVRSNDWQFAYEIDTRTGECWTLVLVTGEPKKLKYEELVLEPEDTIRLLSPKKKPPPKNPFEDLGPAKKKPGRGTP